MKTTSIISSVQRGCTGWQLRRRVPLPPWWQAGLTEQKLQAQSTNTSGWIAQSCWACFLHISKIEHAYNTFMCTTSWSCAEILHNIVGAYVNSRLTAKPSTPSRGWVSCMILHLQTTPDSNLQPPANKTVQAFNTAIKISVCCQIHKCPWNRSSQTIAASMVTSNAASIVQQWQIAASEQQPAQSTTT